MNDINQHRSEGDLLRDAANGDAEAFGLFCESTIPALLKAQRARCHRLGIPIHLAEDFVNDTLVRAVSWIQEHPHVALTKNWIFTVARNLSYDWLRHQSVERRVTDEDSVDNIVDKSGNSEKVTEILEYFVKLKQADKEMLELVLLEGYTPAEAAVELDIELWSAYKRYERALKRLRHLLKSAER